MRDREEMGIRMCDLSTFGETIEDAKVRVRAISERINAIRNNLSMREEFEKEFRFILKRRDDSLEGIKKNEKNFVKENT